MHTKIGVVDPGDEQGKVALLRTKTIGVLLAGVLVLAACGSSRTAPKSAASSTQRVLTVPVLLPETGSEALVGAGQKKSLTALAAELNKVHWIKGAVIKLDFLNNQSSPSVAVSLASSDVIGKYAYFMNGVISNTEIPVNSLVTSSGPVAYNISPAVYPKPGSYVFVGTARTTGVAVDSIRYAKAQGWSRIALMTSTDPSGEDGLKAVETAVKIVGSPETIVANQTFADSATSVSAQVANIAAAHPEALVLWSTGPQIGTVFEAMKAAGLANLPVFMSYGNETFAEMHALSSVLPSHLYSQAPTYMMTNVKPPAAQAARIRLLDASLGVQPGHLSAAPSYCDDGLLLYASAIRHLGQKATATQIRDYIQRLKDWPGIDGIYNFSVSNHRGINGSSYGIVRWDARIGLFDPVSPLGG